MSIPISKVKIFDSARTRLNHALDSGMLAQGPQVGELENLFAERHGARHAVAVNNGTTALVLALEVLNLSPGDEVITTPFTFAATLNAIIESGATARFVDIGDDFLMDADQLGEVINSRTKAIMPVHLYGQMVDMRGVEDSLSRKHGISIVEDAAQAVGSKFQGNSAGSYGIGCFSLYATKNVGCGEGGIVTTNDDALAERMRILRNQGMKARYEYVVPGHNYRLTDLHAAVAIPQMENLDDLIESRKANAEFYLRELKDLEGLILPESRSGDVHVWNQFTIRVTGNAPITRDQFVEFLTKREIGTGIYYPHLVFDYDCYKDLSSVVIAETPKAKAITHECLSIPVHPSLTASDLDYVVSTIREIWSK
jgi:perosamine synthetase